MSANIHTGNSTRFVHKLSSQLSLGKYQMENYRKFNNQNPDMKTYYLTRKGDILTFREWYQAGKPDYIVSGSKHGCQTQKSRRFPS